MFELSFVKKYLTPRRQQLSVSLIALLSIVVITLVVWLVVVFLSVTEGIEKNWLNKLTSLNAPLRLQPTKEYFSSYYYNIDKFSAASHYLSKNLGQKVQSLIADPYDPDFDECLPPSVAKPDYDSSGSLVDPVKKTVEILEKLKKNNPSLVYQDVEMGGALLHLDLIRKEGGIPPVEMQSQLTSVSYLISFPDQNPTLSNLLIPPNEEDLNHLVFLGERKHKKQQIENLLSNVEVHKLKPSFSLWKTPLHFLPAKVPFKAMGYQHRGNISHLVIPTENYSQLSTTIERRDERLFFTDADGIETPLSDDLPLFIQGQIEFNVKGIEGHEYRAETRLQDRHFQTRVGLEGLDVVDGVCQSKFESLPSSPPPWAFFQDGSQAVLPSTEDAKGILIAKNFRESGVRIGDHGYLAYTSPSFSGPKEKQIPVYVAGFYDPGIMVVGNKCIIVPPSITRIINENDSPFSIEKSEANQIFVWFSDLNNAKKIKEEIVDLLRQNGIEKYWSVQTFYEYDFAKDLMQQFQSDKMLFAIIGILILLVACTNIVSLLVLLVSDKKKEIGILRAMGAKRRSIAAIFALCGGSLGLFSCLLGVLLAFLTLRNIDAVVSILSFVQGHDAFNSQFFGPSLPRELSPRALLFAAVATPVLALIAGLIPAIKAARLNPCQTLRSE